MRRVLLLSHTTGYQLRAFNDAAEQLGIELVFATDRCHRLDDPWQDRAVAVRFHDLDASLAAIAARARHVPIDGVLAVGDRPVVLAARAAEALGIRWHTVQGALASTDKRRSRATLTAAGLPSPHHVSVPAAESARTAAADISAYPVVLKPVGLSGSRGVIRANDARELEAAYDRIRALLARPQIRAARAGLEDQILVEEYIDGRELALEGVMTDGVLQVFALFDKPDPLEGPFFEETIYVTPSSLSPDVQARVAETIERAATALGLRHGPIHAECRITPDGAIYVLEAAARPIGGLCSRALSFDDEPVAPGTASTLSTPSTPSTRSTPSTLSTSLEHVLLRHALGESIAGVRRETAASAVMMVPIPERGMLRGVSGEDAARQVGGVSEIRITGKPGQILEPLPEAGSYLGFIFARGETARDADAAVRRAHACLRFDISREIALARPERDT